MTLCKALKNVSYLLSQSHPGYLSSAAHGDAVNLELSLFVFNGLIPISLMALIKCAETYICMCMY